MHEPPSEPQPRLRRPTRPSRTSSRCLVPAVHDGRRRLPRHWAGSVRSSLDIDDLRRAFRPSSRPGRPAHHLRRCRREARGTPGVDELILREDEWLSIEDVSGCDDAELQEKLSSWLDALRPGKRAALPGSSPEPIRLRARVLPGLPPHHRRLLVDGRVHRRVRQVVRGRAFGTRGDSRWGQLPNFARWQRDDRWRGRRSALGYWRRQLSGPLPVLDLPTDSQAARPEASGARPPSSLIRL